MITEDFILSTNLAFARLFWTVYGYGYGYGYGHGYRYGHG